MKFSLILNYFISLFMICSPLTAVPVFLSLTQGRSLRERNRIGITSGIAVGAILILTVWIGAPVLHFLAIRIAAFQCAGGIVLFLLALSMLNAQISPMRQAQEEIVAKPSIAVVPLAIPLMAGPGAISAAIVASTTFMSIGQKCILSVCGLVMGVITMLLLCFSVQIEKYLGNTGLNVVTRIGGLILASLAAEIIFQGIENFIGK
jgi:multiple antibiotic resistance protein